MIKLRNTILAMVMGLFATGALAQGDFIQDSEAAVVAEELFGSGSVKLEFNDFVDASTDFVPKAKLIWTGGDIDMGTEFTVTYTLSRATFAEPVSNSDFMWGEWGPDDSATPPDSERVFVAMNNEVTIERDGGGKNTNSVSFKVIVTTASNDNVMPALNMADPPVYVNDTRKIVFLLPDLNASGLRAELALGPKDPGASATVSTSIEQTKSGGSAVAEVIKDGHMCGTTAVGKAPATVGCPVVDAVAVIESIGNAAGTPGLISLTPTDERSVLVDDKGKASDPQRALLSTVQLQVAEGFGGARDQDGDPIDGFTGDLSGTLAIKVSSDSFGEGDTVYIDSNDNDKVDGREAFDMEDGVASDTVPLDAAAKAIYYVPSGDEPLKHRTSFTTTANTEFADTDAKMRSAKAATATLKLHGIQDRVAKAYAIAPMTSTDIANVRVTCETAAKAGCNVFLDCKDQAGMNTFGEAGLTIGPGATVAWQQDDIADALGLDDGWEGRLACDVLSSAKVSVQILTRAAGVLVNNTAINEGG